MNIKVGGPGRKPSYQVKNLGSWLHPNLNMLHHITNVCKAGFFYLFNIRRIKKYLSRDSLLTLVHAFITSRLDYCNALLYGLPKQQIAKLQRVQNAAARLIMDIGKYSHITPALFELHWLPVPARIHFKILLLAFRAIHGLAPAYISNLLVIKRKSSYNLRYLTQVFYWSHQEVKCWEPWVNVYFRRLHRIYGMSDHCNYEILDL